MSRSRFVALSVVLDVLLVNAGIVTAFFIRFGGELPRFNFSAYLGLAPVITVVYLGAGYIYGLYEPERTESPWAVVRAVFLSVALGTVLTAAVTFFAGPRFFALSRLVIVIAWLLLNALLVGWRLLMLKVTPIQWPEQRVIIVGSDELALELASELQRRGDWGYNVVGLLGRTQHEYDEACARCLPFTMLGTVDDATRIIAEKDADRVIIASPMEMRELLENMALSDEVDVRVEVIPELYEIFIGTVDSIVSDIPLMQLTRPPAPSWYALAKRVLDVGFSVVLLVLLSPLLVAAVISVMLTMGWPVFFRQERVGKDLRPFEVIKFRTMVRDAEKLTGPVLATEDDPRITPLGRVLRRFRIDELPQLFNILLGEMSFVGPRPEREFFVDRYVREIPGYRERYRVKPGVTGLAQVSGSYATTPERKLKYDLIYMYHQNLLMDVQILVETLRVVMTGRGSR